MQQVWQRFARCLTYCPALEACIRAPIQGVHKSQISGIRVAFSRQQVLATRNSPLRHFYHVTVDTRHVVGAESSADDILSPHTSFLCPQHHALI